MKDTKKVAVIGGGIIGTAAAFYLEKEADIQVSLFDLDLGQATKAAAGIISPWLSKRRNKAWYRLVKAGAAFLPRYMEAIGAGETIYKKTGSLHFTNKDHQLEELLEIGKKRREEAPEIGDLNILSPEEIRNLIPIYDQDYRAIFASGGARLDGAALIQHMQEKLKGHWIHEKVLSIRPGFEVKTDQATYHFDQLVLANGAWLKPLLEDMSYEVDLRPQKGQVAELYFDIKGTENWPVVIAKGAKDIIPFSDGKIIIGATHEDDMGFDLSIQPDLVQPMIDEAVAEFSSSLANPEKIAYRSGIRPYTSDYSLFIGQVPGLKGAFAANGTGATGLTAGPLLGYVLAQLIKADDPYLDLADYPIENYIKKTN